MPMDLLPPRPLTSLDAYVRTGGMQALERARATAPDDVIGVLADAGVRGRGGAGFPTARKWAGVRAATGIDDECFVVVNAAEGEPGTFKDRALIRANPFLALEGALIAAHCVGAPRIVVATKSAYHEQVAALGAAIDQLSGAGWIEGVSVELVEGPDQYLFGEETALLEVIEGEDPLPRQIPPYLYGLYTTGPQLGWSAGIDASPGGPATPSANPVVVNNAETFAHAALVVRNGAAWYRATGTTESPGPTIVTITGDVRRPAVAEVPLGIPLGELIEGLSGGARPGRSIKAVLSGVANAALTAGALDAPVTYEGLASAGGGLGSAGFIVYDDTRNMVDVAYQVARFLHVESCGQCNSCKLGTHDIALVLEHLVAGAASPRDPVSSLRRYLAGVTDSARCFLPTQAQVLVASLLDRFPDDLADRLAGGGGDVEAPLPRIVDLRDGVLELAAGPPYKQPDWTLADVPVRLTRR